MQVGENIFDFDFIHPEVTKSIKDNEDIRKGRLDLVVCKEKLGITDFKESIVGIELKGLNPNLDKVVEDIDRLVLSIEMQDKNFKNSIRAGYCLYIKKLGGDTKISTKANLENAMQKSSENLLRTINAKAKKKTTTNIEVITEILSIKTSEDFAQQGNKDDLTADEVAEGTKIVFSVMIKITRQNTGANMNCVRKQVNN